jgi:renalase
MESILKLKNKKIAVIGTGVSSLSFLYSFNPSDRFSVDIFERSKGLSGRCSTRITDGFIYDNGANYISTKNPKVLNFLQNELNSEDLIIIKKWIFPFDKNNFINFNKNDAQIHNSLTKYNYKSGINKLGSLIYEKIKLKEVNTFFSFNLEKLHKTEEGWELHSKEFKYGYYDYIVFGTPAFNVAKVLNNSVFNKIEEENFYKGTLLQKLNEVKYKKIYSMVIAFDLEQSYLEKDFYALINSDREHAISWISIENEKQGRIPENKKNSLCLIIQMSDNFSNNFENAESQTVTSKIKEELFCLLPELKDSKLIFENLKLWRLALPINSIDEKILKDSYEKGFFIIGDSLLGKGRVDGSIQTGFDLYDYISK